MADLGGTTHWEDCWLAHHECAQLEVQRLRRFERVATAIFPNVMRHVRIEVERAEKAAEAELADLADKALEVLDERQGESVGQWAERLAADVADAND